jgi:peptide/nickel transport system substrate-binding protein
MLPPLRGAHASAGQGATPVADPPLNPLLTVVTAQQPVYREVPRPGGLLRVLRPPWPTDDFNPVSFNQDFQVTVSYLDPLLRPDPLTLEPTPWLAENWRWSDDGRTITYQLRHDVAWHDGSPFTAADARFSLTLYRDALESAVRNFFVAMTEIEATDDRTLVVGLSEPDATWLFNASTQPIFQRAQYLDAWTSQPIGERTLAGFDWKASAPIGTGPWRIANWNQWGVDFERHDGYWAGPPHFNRLGIDWRETAADRLIAWEQGEADVVWPVRAVEAASVTGRRGTLYAADAAAVMFAAFNFDNPERATAGLFDDPTIRRALSFAIDRNRYAEEVFGGFIDAAAVGTIAQKWARDPALTSPPRDLREARRLLSAAGWDDLDGDGVRESVDGSRFALTAIFQADGRPELGRVLASVAADLADAGVELTIEPLPEPEFRERWLSTRAYDLIAYAYDLYPGFTDFDLYGSPWDIRTNPQGWNPGGYANTEVDAAIAEALTATSVAAQRRALTRLQRETNDDLFALWLGFPQQLVLVGDEIAGFRPNALWQTADSREWWRR